MVAKIRDHRCLAIQVDDLRYSGADWVEATRRGDLLATLAAMTSRMTATVATVTGTSATGGSYSPRYVGARLN
jgi:hypothetical protein